MLDQPVTESNMNVQKLLDLEPWKDLKPMDISWSDPMK